MAWMAATWGSAGCVEGGGCLPESLGVTQMGLCGRIRLVLCVEGGFWALASGWCLLLPFAPYGSTSPSLGGWRWWRGRQGG